MEYVVIAIGFIICLSSALYLCADLGGNAEQTQSSDQTGKERS